ncbi:MAG: hypothetical protein K9N47_26265 [Prosthecobacter sp.]|uniref:hypothetical protein n=1 Tax=Prosthecobacter sp. TaxID=1965333 RepID=UPI0026204091|nr:hypothetical protein [Prosthecobacter sp.]MCF7789656.1 hypothetical protein [Prosthecobacter sp.]
MGKIARLPVRQRQVLLGIVQSGGLQLIGIARVFRKVIRWLDVFHSVLSVCVWLLVLLRGVQLCGVAQPRIIKIVVYPEITFNDFFHIFYK